MRLELWPPESSKAWADILFASGRKKGIETLLDLTDLRHTLRVTKKMLMKALKAEMA